MAEKSFRERVGALQNELKAPKNQHNSFGKYDYRSCEDILEAVKPLCEKHKVLLTVSDEIVVIGERYYVKATATLKDYTTDEQLVNIALARESEDKKGMDASQVTGATSSYARKYCLNGLFLIDDTKDADTDEHAKETKAKAAKSSSKPKAEASASVYRAKVLDLASKKGINPVSLAKQFGLTHDTTDEEYKKVYEELSK